MLKFFRIFPTEETWNNYGPLLDFGSTNNLVLHEHLFPQHYIVKPQIKTRAKTALVSRKSAKKIQFPIPVPEIEVKFEDVSTAERLAQYEKPLQGKYVRVVTD